MSLPVRRPSQRDKAPFAGDEILDLDGISNGENVRIAGAHPIVDADPAALADLKPGCFGKRRIRANAKGENDKVSPVGLAGFRSHIDGAVFSFLERGNPVAKGEPDAVAFKMILHEPGEFLVNRRQDLPSHLDEGDLDAEVNQILGHFQADEAAAHDNGALRPAFGAACFYPFLDLPGVRDRADLKVPERSIPGKGGRIVTAPGDNTSLS